MKLLLIAMLAMLTFSPAEAIMLIPKSVEIAIGSEVKDQMLEEFGGTTKLKPNQQKVETIGNYLVSMCKRKDIKYNFYVVDSDVVNAFSCPGGFVFITTSIMATMKNDDEIAFVLAHEIGHVACQHGRKAIQQQLFVTAIAAVTSDYLTDRHKEMVNIAYSLLDSGYSRRDEYEADDYGAELLVKAGYRNDAPLRALSELGIDPNPTGQDKYLASHPPTSNRILRLAKKFGYTKEQAEIIIKHKLN